MEGGVQVGGLERAGMYQPSPLRKNSKHVSACETDRGPRLIVGAKYIVCAWYLALSTREVHVCLEARDDRAVFDLL